MGQRRIRQHVNPHKLHFQQRRAVPPPLLRDADPRRPLEVELGCADADFTFARAAACPDRLFLGLEIREAFTERNTARAQQLGLSNVAFAYCNVNVDLDQVIPEGRLDVAHLLFPDPWFKRDHHKRRVVEPSLLRTLSRQLRPGGVLHFASDIFELALAAMEELESPSARALGFRAEGSPWSFRRDAPYRYPPAPADGGAVGGARPGDDNGGQAAGAKASEDGGAQSRRERTTTARGQRVWRLIYVCDGCGASSPTSGSDSASSSAAQRS